LKRAETARTCRDEREHGGRNDAPHDWLTTGFGDGGVCLIPWVSNK
jgi:hypothetical protein